jgi:transcriptional regulator with XRE-family HTH domain
MSELTDKLRTEFQDKEYRDAYAEECLNTMIAAQLKVLREQRNMTQSDVAAATGMKQPRIAVLEDANYQNWSVNTLRRFARAFDVALSVKFGTFSQLIRDFENLSRASLQRPTFAEDPQFQRRSAPKPPIRGRSSRPHGHWRSRTWATPRPLQEQVSNMGAVRKPPASAQGANVDREVISAAGGLR